MLENLSDAQIREHCRSKIESLEVWLRGLINQALSDAYGKNYFDYQDESGNRIIKKKIAESATQKMSLHPGRYHRKIDTILFDEAIDIVCHPNLHRDHFQENVGRAYPGGAEVLRAMMYRLIDIRNRLSHANPISLSDGLRASCYADDIVGSIRSFYAEKGMETEYNVPKILKISDSFGGSFQREEFSPVHDGGIFKDFRNDVSRNLRPGDTLTVEIEVDPAFDSSEYTIRWASVKSLGNLEISGRKIIIPISNHHVGAQWELQCYITSHKDWHRMSLGADDFMLLSYKVLPPF